MKVIVPRPGDAFYADLDYENGKTIRFAINALTVPEAVYEVGYLMAPDRFAEEPGHATLYAVDGREVASGNREWFEEASAR